MVLASSCQSQRGGRASVASRHLQALLICSVDTRHMLTSPPNTHCPPVTIAALNSWDEIWLDSFKHSNHTHTHTDSAACLLITSFQADCISIIYSSALYTADCCLCSPGPSFLSCISLHQFVRSSVIPWVFTHSVLTGVKAHTPVSCLLWFLGGKNTLWNGRLFFSSFYYYHFSQWNWILPRSLCGNFSKTALVLYSVQLKALPYLHSIWRL